MSCFKNALLSKSLFALSVLNVPLAAIAQQALSAVPFEPSTEATADSNAFETIEISDAHPPAVPQDQPTLAELLAQWDRLRAAHVQ